MAPYDECRYQLRLLREQGTVKTELFCGYAVALDAARQWLNQFNVKQFPAKFGNTAVSTTGRR